MISAANDGYLPSLVNQRLHCKSLKVFLQSGAAPEPHCTFLFQHSLR